jgi:hypothetical protein
LVFVLLFEISFALHGSISSALITSTAHPAASGGEEPLSKREPLGSRGASWQGTAPLPLGGALDSMVCIGLAV